MKGKMEEEEEPISDAQDNCRHTGRHITQTLKYCQMTGYVCSVQDRTVLVSSLGAAAR